MAKQNRHIGIEERKDSNGNISYRAKVRIKGFRKREINPSRQEIKK